MTQPITALPLTRAQQPTTDTHSEDGPATGPRAERVPLPHDASIDVELLRAGDYFQLRNCPGVVVEVVEIIDHTDLARHAAGDPDALGEDRGLPQTRAAARTLKLTEPDRGQVFGRSVPRYATVRDVLTGQLHADAVRLDHGVRDVHAVTGARPQLLGGGVWDTSRGSGTTLPRTKPARAYRLQVPLSVGGNVLLFADAGSDLRTILRLSPARSRRGYPAFRTGVDVPPAGSVADLATLVPHVAGEPDRRCWDALATRMRAVAGLDGGLTAAGARLLRIGETFEQVDNAQAWVHAALAHVADPSRAHGHTSDRARGQHRADPDHLVTSTAATAATAPAAPAAQDAARAMVDDPVAVHVLTQVVPAFTGTLDELVLTVHASLTGSSAPGR